MTTMLLMIFGVSLFGIVYMLAFKHAEHKVKRPLFLPAIAHQHDAAIQEWFSAVLHHSGRGLARGGNAGRRVVMVCVNGVCQGIFATYRSIGNQIAPQRETTSKRHGITASPFMEDVRYQNETLRHEREEASVE